MEDIECKPHIVPLSQHPHSRHELRKLRPFARKLYFLRGSQSLVANLCHDEWAVSLGGTGYHDEKFFGAALVELSIPEDRIIGLGNLMTAIETLISIASSAAIVLR